MDWIARHHPDGLPEPHHPDQVAALLADVAQIIDVVRLEWLAENSWSDWDQGVRDRISATLLSIHRAHPNMRMRPTPTDAAAQAASPRQVETEDQMAARDHAPATDAATPESAATSRGADHV